VSRKKSGGLTLSALKKPVMPHSPSAPDTSRVGIRRSHDHNIKERSFNIGDLVLHRIQT
jgi:hypothetical protein